MRINVNGKAHLLDAPISLAALAVRLELNPLQVAMERNLEIVPRSRFAEVMLAEGDAIEIVQFIGGG